MALSAASVWEVRTTGNDTNGGAFVAGAAGTDYSQQSAKNPNGGTDGSSVLAVAIGTTTITCADANFGTTIVGNIVYFAGGTGTIAGQWRQVTARASATSITIDQAIAASTGMTMNVGGALLSPSIAAGNYVASNTIWVRAGTYTISSTSANTAGGIVSLGNGACRFEGYNSVRGDLGTPPLLQVASSGVTSVAVLATATTSSRHSIRNINIDGQSKATIRGVNDTRGANFAYITAQNCTNNGILLAGGGAAFNCYAIGCSGVQGAITGGFQLIGCVARNNTVTGFLAVGPCCFCISAGNTGASSDGFQANSSANFMSNCVAYKNGRSGFLEGNGLGGQYFSCIAEGNTSSGYAVPTNGSLVLLKNCAGFNTTNISGNSVIQDPTLIAYTASAFVDGDNGNFVLNSNAAAGMLLRSLGWPGTFLGINTTAYQDIGAAQHQDLPPIINQIINRYVGAD